MNIDVCYVLREDLLSIRRNSIAAVCGSRHFSKCLASFTENVSGDVDNQRTAQVRFAGGFRSKTSHPARCARFIDFASSPPCVSFFRLLPPCHALRTTLKSAAPISHCLFVFRIPSSFVCLSDLASYDLQVAKNFNTNMCTPERNTPQLFTSFRAYYLAVNLILLLST